MPKIQFNRVAIPAAVVNVSFLSFSSQLLFAHISPGPLSFREAAVFNVLIACVFVCYARACLTDPGYIVPPPRYSGDFEGIDRHLAGRWCTTCDAPKNPRSHHCRFCHRCVAKMDHHCPWTANCVGHRTFPHFLRFLFYSVTAMSCLMYFLYLRVSHLWTHRNMPSVHGPSVFQLTHLVSLCLINFISSFALSVLLISSLWTLGANVYTIEGWEIARHDVLLHRARRNGGYLHGINGSRIRLVKHEFPYDIGIFANICQGMGSSNPLNWFWPLSVSPILENGLHFETNGFENAGVSWPPPDPDRLASYKPNEAHDKDSSPQSSVSHYSLGDISEVRRRQHQDYERRGILKNGNLSSLTMGSTLRSGKVESPHDFGVDEQADYDNYRYSSDD